ncbi:chymotrypsin-1-like isoform X1 [Temnothorax nylanderi]|uniref:chymotrypsin-1-like isoform X1 n=1 Tax=Temnothorax nylanderi TaxID=102681 RepID=UPI003A8B5A69
MRALACLVFIALAYATQGNPYLHKDAPVGKFPYQVSLKYRGKYYGCSGSILNNRNILTTARCVVRLENELDKLKAHVGTNFLNELGDVYDIESVSIHEDYDTIRLYDNDIALVHLKTPIKYNKLVQPINFMTSNENLFSKPCTLSGWKTKPDHTDTPFNNLAEVKFIIYTLGSCGGARYLGVICGLTTDEEGWFYFDSGSPLVANGTQIGLLSFNFEMRGPHLKGFAGVSNFTVWINAHLKNLGSSHCRWD